MQVSLASKQAIIVQLGESCQEKGRQKRAGQRRRRQRMFPCSSELLGCVRASCCNSHEITYIACCTALQTTRVSVSASSDLLTDSYFYQSTTSTRHENRLQPLPPTVRTIIPGHPPARPPGQLPRRSTLLGLPLLPNHLSNNESRHTAV